MLSTLPIRAAHVQKPVLQKARLGQETLELRCQTKATYRPVRSRVTPLSAAHFTGLQFSTAMYKTGNRVEGANVTMRILRRFIREIGLTVLRVDVRMSAEAFDRLRSGGAIVRANHVSFLDGVAIALASTVPLVYGSETGYSRRSCFARTGMELLVRLGFAEAIVPLDAEHPFGMRELERRLAAGQSVMIFPEGQISPDGRPLPERPGVAWLKSRTGAAIVDVRIRGAEQSRLFAKSGRRFWPRINLRFQTHEGQCEPCTNAATVFRSLTGATE